MGLIPTLGARLAQLTFAPGLLLTDGEATCCAPGGEAGGDRGLAALPLRVHDGGGRPAARDDGRRADRPVRQPEHLLHRRPRPAQGPAARRARRARATPSTTRSATGCPGTRRRVFVERVDMVCGVGYDRAAALGPQAAVPRAAPGRHQPGGAGLRARRTTPCGSRSVHPGVPVGDVTAATGFPLAIPGEVPVTRLPGAGGAGA